MAAETPITPSPPAVSHAPRRSNSVDELRRSFSNVNSPHVVTNHMDFISKLKEEERQYNYKKQLAKLRLQHPEWSGGPFEDFIRRLEKGKQRDRVAELQRWAKDLSRSGEPVTPSRVRAFLDLVGEAYSTPRRSARRRDSPELEQVDQRTLSFDGSEGSQNEEELAKAWKRAIDELVPTDADDEVLQYVAGKSRPPSPTGPSDGTISPSTVETSASDSMNDFGSDTDGSPVPAPASSASPASSSAPEDDGVQDSTFGTPLGPRGYISEEAAQHLSGEASGESGDFVISSTTEGDSYTRDPNAPICPPSIARSVGSTNDSESLRGELIDEAACDPFGAYSLVVSPQSARGLFPPFTPEADKLQADQFGVARGDRARSPSVEQSRKAKLPVSNLGESRSSGVKYGLVAVFTALAVAGVSLRFSSAPPQPLHDRAPLYPPGFEVSGTTVMRHGQSISPAWTLTRTAPDGSREKIRLSMRRLMDCDAPEEPVPFGPWFLSPSWWKVRRFAVEQRKLYRKSQRPADDRSQIAVVPRCFL